jgi:drug/metabolite transporter (DMT)-like permease
VLLLVQLLFAGFAVVGKAVLVAMPPLVLAALRVLGATPLLLLVAWRHDRVLPGRGELPRLALLGLLGVTANQVLFVFGLQRTTATNASILMLSIPVFAVALGGVLGVDRPDRRQLAGITLAVGGALVLLDPVGMTTAPGTAAGNALILANCLSYALFLVLQRPLLQRLPWRTVIAWAFLFGSIGVLPLAAPELATFPLATLSAAVWLGVLYVVLFATVLGYALSTWAVRRSSPSLVAAYTTAQPLFAAGLAAAFLGERIGGAEIAGFACIAAGLALAGGRRPPTTAVS